MTTRTIPRLLLAAATALAPGCGPAPEAAVDGGSSAIEQVGLIVRARRETGKNVPNTLKEAGKVPGAAPEAIEALRSGDVAIYWGADLDEFGTGAAVVGYEKDAPAKGGRVVLGDGAVVELTADQIRDLPKPSEELLKPGGPARTKRKR